jgi:hypothetical protein
MRVTREKGGGFIARETSSDASLTPRPRSTAREGNPRERFMEDRA